MDHAYTPQTFSPPGSIVEELMEERGLDPHSLALALGLSEQGLADLLRATRGFHAQTIQQAQALLDDLQGVGLEGPPPVVDEDDDDASDPLSEGEDDEALAQQIRAYHKEWATIARKAIKDRRILRGMGLVSAPTKRAEQA